MLEDKFKDRYISQYELVSFSTVPYRSQKMTKSNSIDSNRYAEAQRIGGVNSKILAALTKDAERDISKIDMAYAARLIKEYLGK